MAKIEIAQTVAESVLEQALVSTPLYFDSPFLPAGFFPYGTPPRHSAVLNCPSKGNRFFFFEPSKKEHAPPSPSTPVPKLKPFFPFPPPHPSLCVAKVRR